MASKRIIFWAVILVAATTAYPAASQQADLDLQEKCSKQAQRAFEHTEFHNKKMAAFINHYNVKLNRCLIQTEETVPYNNGVTWIYKFVVDANEGKIFATYMWHTEKNKKYWEVPPFACQVTLPSGDEKVCTSSDEFDELIKTYME